MRPVCLKCKLEMNCKKNGVMAKTGVDLVRFADQWACPCCDYEIMTGWGKEEVVVSQKAMQSPLLLVDLTGNRGHIGE